MKMYSRCANKIAAFLIMITEKENCKNKDLEVISYGVELLLSSTVNLIIVLTIGSFLFGVRETVAFTLLFCPIRQYSGGFHARSYLECTMGFLVLFVVIGDLICFVDNNWCYLVGCIVCIVLIWIISPVDTKNKRLGEQLRDKCRRKIKIILGVEFVCIVVLFILTHNEYLRAATMALAMNSVLLGWGNYKCYGR